MERKLSSTIPEDVRQKLIKAIIKRRREINKLRRELWQRQTGIRACIEFFYVY
jgi:hypothetical protein